MTGGGGVMMTSASTDVVYSALQAPQLDLRGCEGERGRKGGDRRRKEVNGEEVGGKERGWKKKGRRNGKGSEGRDGTPLFGTK